MMQFLSKQRFLLSGLTTLCLILILMFISIFAIRQKMHLVQYAIGSDIYVSTAGSDSNTGSSSSPFLTINKAASVAIAGTTVHVAPGIYGPLSNTVSGTATAPVTYISDVPYGAKITAPSVATGTSLVFNNGSYVTIKGFEVYGTSTFNGFLGIFTTGIYTKIIGNKVHDIGNTSCNIGPGGAGIDTGAFNYATSDIDIIGNIVYNIGPKTDCVEIHGIYISVLRARVFDNISYDNGGWGIHCWHACNEVTVSNNLTFNNRKGGILIGAGDDPGGIITDNSVVTNNIAIYNSGYGIQEYEYSGQHTIGANNLFSNNIVYGNQIPGLSLLEGNTDTLSFAIDPQLVNYQADGSGDYHLKSTSPAINSGIVSAISYDFDGVSRPQGSGYDIGPYEYPFASSAITPMPTMTPGSVAGSPSSASYTFPGATPTPTPFASSPRPTPVNSTQLGVSVGSLLYDTTSNKGLGESFYYADPQIHSKNPEEPILSLVTIRLHFLVDFLSKSMHNMVGVIGGK